MLKNVLLTVLVASFVLPVAVAGDLETQLTLTVIQNERKELVEAAVRPAPQQEKEFWDVYWAYRTDIANLNNRSVKLVKEYGDSYAALNDDQAERMVKEAAAIDVERVKARKKCVKKLQKILIPKQVVRFLQIENKMDAMLLLEMAVDIPFDR